MQKVNYFHMMSKNTTVVQNLFFLFHLLSTEEIETTISLKSSKTEIKTLMTIYFGILFRN